MSRKDICTKIAYLAQCAGYAVRSYSGRAMYGVYCVGVALDRDQREAQLIARLAAQVAEEAADNEDDNKLRAVQDALNDFADIMSETRSDSLGLGSIVYWPYARWNEQVDDTGKEFETEEED